MRLPPHSPALSKRQISEAGVLTGDCPARFAVPCQVYGGEGLAHVLFLAVISLSSVARAQESAAGYRDDSERGRSQASPYKRRPDSADRLAIGSDLNSWILLHPHHLISGCRDLVKGTASIWAVIRKPSRRRWLATQGVMAIVSPCTLCNTFMISLAAAASRFPVGSSARMSAGLLIRALAIATRCSFAGQC
jgi:hypothetical protein